MANKKLTKSQLIQTKTYIDLYKWLSRAMASAEWNSVYVPYFKSKAAYQDVLNTYVGFKKEFEKATKGLSIDYTSKKELTEDELVAVHTAIGKMGEKGDIGKINLLLGRTFGESAGRYEALLEALSLEAMIDKKERELNAVIRENEALKGTVASTDPELLARVTELRSLYAQMEQDIVEVNKQLRDNGRTTVRTINSTKEAIMSQISGLYKRAESFENNFDARFGSIEGLVRDAEHGIGHGISHSIAETRKVGEKVDGLGEELSGTEKRLGAKIDESERRLSAKIDAKKGSAGKKALALSLAGLTVFGAGMGVGALITGANQPGNESVAYYLEQISQYQQKIQELEAKLANSKSQEEYNKIANELAQVKQAFEEYKESHSASNDEVKAQLGKLTAEIEALKEQIKVLGDPTAIADLQNQIKELQKEYDDYKAAHTFSNEEYTEKLNKIAELEAKLANSKTQEEYNKLLDEYNKAKDEFELYKKDHTYSNSEYQQKVDKVKELEEALRNSVSQEEHEKVLNALSKANKDLADYKVSHKYSNDEYEAKAKKVEELEAKLANSKTQEEYNKLLDEYNKAKKEFDNYKKDHTYTNDEVMELQDKYKAEIAELKDALSKCKTEEEFNAAISKYQSFINELIYKLTYNDTMTEDEAMDYIANMYGFDYSENTKGSEQDTAQRGN